MPRQLEISEEAHDSWRHHKIADVTPWEEYWAFGREEDRWKLKEIFPDEQGNAIWDQENFDEDTTQQMLDWYYSKSRAV